MPATLRPPAQRESGFTLLELMVVMGVIAILSVIGIGFLTKREDGMYLGKIEDPQVLRYEFFLAAQGSVPESQIRDRLPKLSKIASWNHISSILNSAVNGAKLDLEYRPPGALPVKPGVIFFKVIRTPEYWNDIAGTGTIAIYQPMEPSSMNLSLYAVDPANLQ